MFITRLLETNFGKMWATYTGGGHICLRTDSETGPIEVRKGSPLTLNVHLYRNEEGVFVPRESEMILSKYDWTRVGDRDAAPSFRKKVLEMIPSLVCGLFSAEEMAAEDRAEIVRKVSRLDSELAKLEEQAAPLREQRKALMALLD